jgi:hypothetical protein
VNKYHSLIKKRISSTSLFSERAHKIIIKFVSNSLTFNKIFPLLTVYILFIAYVFELKVWGDVS